LWNRVESRGDLGVEGSTRWLDMIGGTESAKTAIDSTETANNSTRFTSESNQKSQPIFHSPTSQ
jgi:hypothetical protein